MPGRGWLRAAGAVVLLSACDDSVGTLFGPSVIGLSVSVTPAIDTIFAADTMRATDVAQLTTVLRRASAPGPVKGIPVTWTSSDPSIASVDEAGKVTAHDFGTVTIVADANGKRDSAQISVVHATSRLVMSQATAVLLVDDPVAPRDTVRLRASALDRFNQPVTGTVITWQSNAPAVATVDANGTVRAIGLGSAIVRATGAGVSAATAVTVAPLVATVRVTTPVTSALVSDTLQLNAAAFNAANAALGGRTYVWTSSNASVATVDSTGRAFLRGTGSTTISARTGFVTGNVVVQVLPRTLTAVDAGNDFVCGVANLGRGYCWGVGDIGQLGVAADSLCADENDPTAEDPCAIAPLRFGSGLALSGVSAGGASACAIGGDSQVYCWGSDEFGQLGDGQRGTRFSGLVRASVSTVRFSSVSVGGAHACAISTTEEIYCWGLDAHGQLGDARRIISTTPIPLGPPADSLRWRRVSAGARHTCAITTAGAIYCWGDNSQGQLGNGTTAIVVDTAGPVAGVGATSFAEISAGDDHTCAVATGGDMYCWGSNLSGQIGQSTIGVFRTPTRVLAVAGAVSVTAGGGFTCAVTPGGVGTCWGRNDWGQLGRGFVGAFSSQPQSVVDGKIFSSISAGRRHTCGVTTSQETWCWGSNVFGALGNELQAAQRGRPQKVATPR